MKRLLLASVTIAAPCIGFAATANASTVDLAEGPATVYGGDKITANGTVTDAGTYSFSATAGENLTLSNIAFTVDQTDDTDGETLSYSIDDGDTVWARVDYNNYGITNYIFDSFGLSEGQTVQFDYTVASVMDAVSDYGLGMTASADSPAAPVPLPAAGWMLLAGAGALGAVSRRRKARAAA